MQRVHWTEAQRQQALEIYERDGAAEASRQTGIPVATISSWARRAGRTAITPEREAAIAAKNLTLAQRKGQLADGLLDDCVRLRRQLFSPIVEKKPMVVSFGKDAGSRIEIAEVDLNQPSPADQQRIATTLTTLLDKVLLLTGDATARVETTGQIEQDRAKAEATVIALADRRAS